MDGFAAHLFNASYFFPLSNPSFTLSVCLPFTSSRVSLKSPCDDWNLVHHEVRTSENGGWFFLLDCSSRAINFPWTIDLGVGIIKRKIVGFWDDPSIFTHISVTTPTSKRGHIFFWDRIMYIPWKSNMYTENDGLEKRYVLFNFQGCLYVQICINITYKKKHLVYTWFHGDISYPYHFPPPNSPRHRTQMHQSQVLKVDGAIAPGMKTRYSKHQWPGWHVYLDVPLEVRI